MEEEKARASLRQVVHELREVLEEAGCHALQADRLTVAIDIGSVALDVHAVLGQAELRSVHPLLLDVPRLTETLLQGLDDIDPAFRVWLLANRQALHDRLLRALDGAAPRRGRGPAGGSRRRSSSSIRPMRRPAAR